MVFRKKKDSGEDKEAENDPRENSGSFDPFARDAFGSDAFDDIFGDFGRVDELMNELMRNMFRGMKMTGSMNMEPGKPMVYGFSMKTGPDGKPVVEEFGNVKSTTGPVPGGAREPMVDVMENEKEIIVIAELPGVEKSDIDLTIDEDTLTIDVDAKKKYYKIIKLPADVKDTVDASYNNGILEVRLERKTELKKKGKKINIK